MKDYIKSAVAVCGILLATLSLVYASYLPFRKAQKYITALTIARSARTIGDFQTAFNAAFSFYSPIGTEEITKFLITDILNFVVRGKQDEQVIRAMVDYAEPLAVKNNVRHLIAMGHMYAYMWGYYGKDTDYQKSEMYYRTALAIGPKLPPVLYSLFDLYRLRGDLAHFEEIGHTILGLWPDDSEAKGIFDKVESLVQRK